MAESMDETRPDTRWNAFLSYSSRDAPAVARIQRFVESYRLPKGRRLRVYRDETDIAGGELPEQLRNALGASGCLLVCCSEAAAQSDWVAREIEAFCELAPNRPILPILLTGKPPEILPPSLRGHELRWADLRSGWRLGLPHAKTRIELVRVVAAAADIDFRRLLPLDRRRRRRRAGLAGMALGASLSAVMLYPVLDWQDVTPSGLPVFGCGTLDDGIAFYRLNEPQAIKNIVNVEHDALGPAAQMRPLDRSITPRDRLLPGMLGVAHDHCHGSRDGWVGAPRPGLCVSVGESEETGSFDDHMGGTEAALTEITVNERRSVLDRMWSRIDSQHWQNYGRTVHPSSGLAVAATVDELWLGFPASEFSRGDLWHSSDGGGNWQRRPGINDVHSVRQLSIGTLIAARQSGQLGFYLLSNDDFEALNVPGKGDDIEICGEAEGQPVLRADRRVYRRTHLPRWRTLWL